MTQEQVDAIIELAEAQAEHSVFPGAETLARLDAAKAAIRALVSDLLPPINLLPPATPL